MTRYLRFSRSPYYAVVAALPLLMAYELLLMGVGWTPTGQVRNAADVWLRMLLASLDVRPEHATLVMILVLLLAIPVVRRDHVRLEPRYFVYMLAEAVGYSLVLGVAVRVILVVLYGLLGGGPATVTASAVALSRGALQGLALSAGAGLFEEFVFRVVLLSALLVLTRMVLAGWLAALVSIVAAAFLFSLAHYVGPYGDPLTLVSFLYRFVAGLLFTAIYYTRGFAVVAYTHALYDIRVILF